MADADMRCARGHAVPPKARNCPECGVRIEWSEPEPRPPPAPSGATVTSMGPTATDAAAPGLGGRLIPALTVDLVVSSPSGERSIELASGDALDIGRDVGPLTGLCTDNVSGRHAQIRVGDEQVVLEDIGSHGRGSTNGTYVDGVRLPANQPTPLPDEAVVTCGSQPPLTISVKVTRL